MKINVKYKKKINLEYKSTRNLIFWYFEPNVRDFKTYGKRFV